MARSITDIKKSMTDNFLAQESVQKIYGITPLKNFEEQYSKVSIENLLFYIVACAIWTLENLFDLHKQEVLNIITTYKPHTLNWYANKAKDFQYGYALPIDSDVYDNTGIEADKINASKIVAQISVEEVAEGLRINAVKADSQDLAQLTDEELNSFSNYMERIKDAGIKLVCESFMADSLKLSIDIYYDPLVLTKLGDRIDGTQQIVTKEAIKEFLKNLPFNGILVLAYLVEYLQQIEGIVIPHITKAQAKGADFDYQNFDVKYKSISGYIRIMNDDDLTINYIQQTPIK